MNVYIKWAASGLRADVGELGLPSRVQLQLLRTPQEGRKRNEENAEDDEEE